MFREHAYLIPLFPVAGFLFNGILGSRLSKKVVALVACLVIAASLFMALGAIGEVMQHPHEQFEKEFSWVGGFELVTGTGQTARFEAPFGFLIDPLTAVMLFVVCFIGFLIHVYATAYMEHEDGYYRFFAYLNLFMAMMLTLVLANNLLMMFVGWEGVGLCSYLLIGFYYEKKSAGDAGKKAFVVNRVGDFGFALGALLILYWFGTIRFTEIAPMAQHLVHAQIIPVSLVTGICLLLFVGATGKSAQIPLYVWLPDAMEGPTPVSALIHAATMVTSGIYMIARLNGLFSLSPEALGIIAIVGAATALFAATIAITQNDIKRVLAYSTVSQLGYMFLALGLGAYGAAVFHLMTHAFFKACLFLGSGSVIHAMSGEQDMRKMGGLRKHIPHTFWTFFISTFAIAGFFPLSGFFSKDEILWNAFGYGRFWLWGVGFLTAGLTAFYMFRLVYLTFFQSERFDDHVRHHLHESPPRMTIPLWILAAGAALAGLLGIPVAMSHGVIPNVWEHWLEPVIGEGPERHAVFGHSMELVMAIVSFCWAVFAWLVARSVYRRETDIPAKTAKALQPLYLGSLRKWYVDEIYDALIVNPIKKLTAVCDFFDRWVVDGLVNLVRHLTIGVSIVSKVFDLGFVDGLVNLVAGTVRFFGRLGGRVLQTGRLQTYAYYFIVGVFVMVGLFLIWGGGAHV